jgi:hypothetical protein
VRAGALNAAVRGERIRAAGHGRRKGRRREVGGSLDSWAPPVSERERGRG